MDKWKDIELEKMKVGGNRPAKDFFRQHADFDLSTANLQQKYNSRAAALYRDKIGTEARGNVWSIDASPAFNYEPPNVTETTPSTRPVAAPEQFATSISTLSTNASKWAGVAKDSVLKFSKSAATKATELSTKVTEQAKDGTLMTNAASTVGQFGTKTWSGMQSFFQAKKAPPPADKPRLEIQRSPSATVRPSPLTLTLSFSAFLER